MMSSRQFVPARNKNKGIRIAVVAAVLILIFTIPVTRSAVKSAVHAIGMTVARSTHAVGGWFSGIGTMVRSKYAIENENTNLKVQIEELTARLSERDMLARENADLKQTLGRTNSAHFILAAVIAKPPHSIYDTLIIDGGTSIGLSVGQIVYANGETPIGFIQAVTANTATVELYSASGEKFDARLSPSNIDVTLIGRGGGNFSATVTHDVVIPDGAIVVTKEIHPYTVALFQKITSDPRDPFQTLLLSAPVNINELSFVEVRQ